MDEAQLIGYAVLAIISLGGFLLVVSRFTQPVQELMIAIQELRAFIATLREDAAKKDRRLDSLDSDVDELKDRVGRIETKMRIYHKDG